MPHRPPRFGLALVAVVGFLLTGACGGPSTIQRGSTSAPPTIDGALNEWGGSLAYVDDGPVSMSVMPTDSLLYVALATQDQRLIRSVVKNGLIVWVDPAGGQTRSYGIRYPLGLRAQRAAAPQATDPSGSSQSSRRPSSFDQLSMEELAVIRRDGARVRIPAQFSSGVRAQATLDPGALVYELAIPVGPAAGGDRERHGLRASLGSTVSIGLQTPEEDEESDASMPESNVPSVTGRRGRTRRRGRNRRRRRARQTQNQDASLPTLDLWTRVATDGT